MQNKPQKQRHHTAYSEQIQRYIRDILLRWKFDANSKNNSNELLTCFSSNSSIAFIDKKIAEKSRQLGEHLSKFGDILQNRIIIVQASEHAPDVARQVRLDTQVGRIDPYYTPDTIMSGFKKEMGIVADISKPRNMDIIVQYIKKLKFLIMPNKSIYEKFYENNTFIINGGLCTYTDNDSEISLYEITCHKNFTDHATYIKLLNIPNKIKVIDGNIYVESRDGQNPMKIVNARSEEHLFDETPILTRTPREIFLDLSNKEHDAKILCVNNVPIGKMKEPHFNVLRKILLRKYVEKFVVREDYMTLYQAQKETLREEEMRRQKQNITGIIDAPKNRIPKRVIMMGDSEDTLDEFDAYDVGFSSNNFRLDIYTNGGILGHYILMATEDRKQLMIDRLNGWDFSAEDLIKTGCICFLTCKENFPRARCPPDFYSRPLAERPEYCEIDQIVPFGYMTNSVPNFNNTYGVRIAYQAGMFSQTMCASIANVMHPALKMKLAINPMPQLCTTEIAQTYTKNCNNSVTLMTAILIDKMNPEDGFCVLREAAESKLTYITYTTKHITITKKTINENGVSTDVKQYPGICANAPKNRFGAIDKKTGFPIIGAYISPGDAILAKYKKIKKDNKFYEEDMSVYANIDYYGVVDSIVLSDWQQSQLKELKIGLKISCGNTGEEFTVYMDDNSPTKLIKLAKDYINIQKTLIINKLIGENKPISEYYTQLRGLTFSHRCDAEIASYMMKDKARGKLSLQVPVGVHMQFTITSADMVESSIKRGNIKVKFALFRHYIDGGKLAARYSQKGTIGVIKKRNEMPYVCEGDDEGMYPEILISPAAFLHDRR